ncbi:hypothetical protein JW752_03190 [Candidatus Peregrinibacteria bacterium]|nr:hypothetical protein [Candidatus Peregrinibacteria bacterium]
MAVFAVTSLADEAIEIIGDKTARWIAAALVDGINMSSESDEMSVVDNAARLSYLTRAHFLISEAKGYPESKSWNSVANCNLREKFLDAAANMRSSITLRAIYKRVAPKVIPEMILYARKEVPDGLYGGHKPMSDKQIKQMLNLYAEKLKEARAIVRIALKANEKSEKGRLLLSAYKDIVKYCPDRDCEERMKEKLIEILKRDFKAKIKNPSTYWLDGELNNFLWAMRQLERGDPKLIRTYLALMKDAERRARKAAKKL